MRATPLFLLLALIAGCASPSKISFDINRLDADGLQGSVGAKRSLSYEYCAPNTPQWKNKILFIDPSSTFMEHSPGRSGCKADEMLIIGNTHQKNHNEILKQLSNLVEITTIRESHFE